MLQLYNECRLLLKRPVLFHPSTRRIISDIIINHKRQPASLSIQSRHLITRPPPGSNSRIISFDNARILQKYHNIDRVPMKKYTLIYRCTFPNYLLLSQMMNFFVFFVVSMSAMFKALEMWNPPPSVEEQEKIIEQKTHELEEMKIANEPPSWRNCFGISQKAREWDLWAESEKGKVLQNEWVAKLRFPIDEEPLPKPSLDDLEDAGLGTYSIFLGTMAVLLFAMIKLQRTLPIRIYTSSSGHSIGVYYGHLIPARLTKHEFVAGTLKIAVKPTKRLTWSHSVYKDGAGKKMMLFENMFRYPADFNNLVGIKNPLMEEEVLERDDEF